MYPRTPGTPARWRCFEEELETLWEELSVLASRMLGKLDGSPRLRMSVARRVLRLYYFWVQMGALSRGTAATGLALLIGLSLACGLPLALPLPSPTQLDWEAILTPDHQVFVETWGPQLMPGIGWPEDEMETPDPLPWNGRSRLAGLGDVDVDSLPTVQEAIPTFRAVLETLALSELPLSSEAVTSATAFRDTTRIIDVEID